MNNEKEIVKEPKIEFYLILDYQIASEWAGRWCVV